MVALEYTRKDTVVDGQCHCCDRTSLPPPSAIAPWTTYCISTGLLTDMALVSVCEGHVDAEAAQVNLLRQRRRVHYDTVLRVQHTPEIKRKPF